MALIINADMPKDCYDCYINNNWTFDYICPLMERGADLDTWLKADCRHPSCPIIGEIPDKHGRLIDADVMKEAFEATTQIEAAKDKGNEQAYSNRLKLVHGIIDRTPTVLERTT